MTKKKTTDYRFTIRGRKFQVIADKVLFFRLLQRLHGRFWGVAAIIGSIIGLTICFAIQPNMWQVSTAFSDFGRDVRTAPFFAGSMFFAAYGLWRWRNYLRRTLKRPGPVIGLLTLTIIGLYLVALMPVSWHPWPYRVHFFGVFLAGGSMALTVVLDGLLTKTRKSGHARYVRLVRFISVLLILTGGFLTFGSAEVISWFSVALVGESLILFGYGLWVYMKTIQGEGPRTRLSHLVQKIIIVK